MVRLSDLPKSVQRQVLAKVDEQDAQPGERRARAERNHGRWRCGGPRGCGDVIDGTWQSMERHMDSHGGGRAEAEFTVKRVRSNR